MNTTDLVDCQLVDSDVAMVGERTAPPPSYHELLVPVRTGILRARRSLRDATHRQGVWLGRQHGDTTLASQLVFLLALREQEQSALAEQVVNAILHDQRPDGGWARTPDGPADVSVSVQAYCALKIAGQEGAQPFMRRARQTIRGLGGADAADITTRLWLAVFSQVDYGHCRPLPVAWPETPPSLAGRAFHRAASGPAGRRLTALSLVWALRPRRAIEVARGVRELFIQPPDAWPRPASAEIGFALSRCWDRARAKARLVDDVLCTNPHESRFDELAWQMVALHALGFGDDGPEFSAADARLQRLAAVDDWHDEARPQPAASATIDTAVAADALLASGVSATEPQLARSLQWLARRGGAAPDASRSIDNLELAALLSAVAITATGASDMRTGLPPDIHVVDTQSGCWRRTRRAPRTRGFAPFSPRRVAEEIGNELTSRQNCDGGWSAVLGGRVNQRTPGVLRATHRPARAESAPDVTGAALVALANQKIATAQQAIGDASAYLRAAQRADGSWDSATGVRLIHGTSWALRGLAAAGGAADDPAVAAGVNWLVVHQLDTGGWGETVGDESQADEFVPAAATAIQTAWAVLALTACGHADHTAVRRGVQFLVDTQEEHGHWDELQFTLRNVAAARLYRNELHSTAVPLAALSQWVVAAACACATAPCCLRLLSDESLSC